jgi:hypothetical protein
MDLVAAAQTNAFQLGTQDWGLATQELAGD